jgi:serralysin
LHQAVTTWGRGATVTFSFDRSFTLQGSATAALGAWAAVADIKFTPVSTGGTIKFSFGTSYDTGGYAYYPGTSSLAGDVFINPAYAGGLALQQFPGSYGWFVMLHETGHALGLEHVDESANVSIMTAGPIKYPLPSEPLPYDIASIQALYGANPAWLDPNSDTIDIDVDVVVDMQVYGTSGDDRLTGGAGDDDLSGGFGADWFIFGQGHDEVYGLDATDRIHITGYGKGSFADVMARASYDGASTTITLDPNNSLTLVSLHPSQLTADQFLVG